MKKRVWQLQVAKNRFSELVKRAQKGEPQQVTKNNMPVVYVIDVKTYDKKIGSRNKSKRDVLRKRPHKDVELFTDRDKSTGRDIQL